MDQQQFNHHLRNIADKINAKRRAELVTTFSGTDGLLKDLQQIRDADVYKRGTKDKSARKIATIPQTHWQFFEDQYHAQTGSKEFWKDLKWLRTHAPEFLVVHPKDL